MHPDVTGTVTLTLKQVTLPRGARDRARGVRLRLPRTAGTYVVLPATLQNRVFEIDYLNLIRGGMSRTRVSSGQVTQNRRRLDRASDESGVFVSGDDGSDQASKAQATGSVIDTVNNSDFWAELQIDARRRSSAAAEGRQIVVNAQSGVVFARGMPDELRAVGDYLAAHPRRRAAPGRARSQDHRGHARATASRPA